ncbi:hypothetical protein [Microbacterium sp. NPDC056569]|uniref:hypothetical protein n=1 Tax=Microbacterium sp. NPDC056569 TaxID=3345867 RepID=UPI00366B1EAD
MDAATLDELHTLRARAYGPSADIDEDPAALERLRELEARRAAAATATPVEPPLVAEPAVAPERQGAAVTVVVAPEASDAQPEAEEASTSDEPDEPRARRRRRGLSSSTWALWALSVVAAAALAAGLTYSATAISPISASSGATQIDTLDPYPLADVPAGWFGAGPSSLAFDYFGLTLFETSGGYGALGTDCFSLVATEELPEPDADANSWSMSGIMLTGCAVGSFPATIQLAVDSSAPQQLRDRFPADSALQFVFDGDRVGVYLDSGAAD